MIKVKFFAMLRQIFNENEVEIEAGKAANVRELIQELDQRFPGVEESLENVRAKVAVNHEFADADAPLSDGDEVAFIPPMSGGSGLVRIQRENFSIDEEVELVKKSSSQIGGIDIFLGTARDISRDRAIDKLEFEHYPGMAEKKLEQIREAALGRFEILEIGIVHRFGSIDIGENIVLIIAAARHRKAAFEACRWCIDELKEITPIWKKEITVEGDFWVEEHP